MNQNQIIKYYNQESQNKKENIKIQMNKPNM